MYTLRSRSRIILALLDLTVAVAAVYLAGFARWGVSGYQAAWHMLGLRPEAVAITVAVIWLACLWFQGLYRPERLWSTGEEALTLWRAGAFLGLAVATIIVMFKVQDVSRLFLLGCGLLLVAGSLAGRLALRAIIRYRGVKGIHRVEVLVVGAGSRAAEFISRVEANPLIGVHVAGVLCNQTDKAKTKDQLGLAGVEAPLLGAVADLPNVLRTHVVDTVVVALPFADFATITEVTHVAEEQGKQVHVLLDGLASKLKDSHFDVILGHPALSVSPGAHRTLELAGKRIVDFCGALSALVCMSPLFVVLGVLIKFDSPGPVFFKQKRVGLNGRLFTLYKFRTMVVDAESRLAQLQHLNEMTGPVFKIRNDPRITRVGRFLRRTSLDELPQFINVLLGQMSIVGPRPPLPHEVEQYEEWQLRRLSVKPGLTCFWQVEGRNDIPFDQWVRLDLEYIDTWSLTTDVKLILKTIPVMFGAKGA